MFHEFLEALFFTTNLEGQKGKRLPHREMSIYDCRREECDKDISMERIHAGRLQMAGDMTQPAIVDGHYRH